MKISDKQTARDIGKKLELTSARNTSAGVFSLFSSELSAREHDVKHFDQDIAGLRNELDVAGQLLEREPTIENFKRFRGVLSTLAKQVSDEAYRLEKIGGTPANPRYYEVITIIDKEADKLYELIVKEQKDRMAITASVIGIKGLVVDLFS